MVETASLERMYTRKGIVGSNPTFSASSFDYSVEKIVNDINPDKQIICQLSSETGVVWQHLSSQYSSR